MYIYIDTVKYIYSQRFRYIRIDIFIYTYTHIHLYGCIYVYTDRMEKEDIERASCIEAERGRPRTLWRVIFRRRVGFDCSTTTVIVPT